ncbi:MAG TPA: nuclear transport factor 2 family protein [Terriglobales bacterium]|nr:nuclear transport factor 2 family protein [Terriglobales bacterium]
MSYGIIVAFLLVVLSQTTVAQSQPSQVAPAQPDLQSLFASRIHSEWEALKAKDKKAYGDLLADDFEGVEVDGRGERTKSQAVNEVADENVSKYTLWGLKVTPLGPNAAFVTYEVTMEFPPKSVLRYSRVLVGEVWVKRDGQWKELHYQETHVK